MTELEAGIIKKYLQQKLVWIFPLSTASTDSAYVDGSSGATYSRTEELQNLELICWNQEKTIQASFDFGDFWHCDFQKSFVAGISKEMNNVL